MITKGEFLKCECGSNTFKVRIINDSSLLFVCNADGCEQTMQLDLMPNADNITKMVTGYLSDKAKSKIINMFMKQGRG